MYIWKRFNFQSMGNGVFGVHGEHVHNFWKHYSKVNSCLILMKFLLLARLCIFRRVKKHFSSPHMLKFAPLNILFLQNIHVNGEWSVWGAWGTCSLTCGGGQASRARTCSDPYPANGGLDCVGTSSEFGTCNNDSCPTVAPGTYVNVSKMWQLNER
jgi:hypothetical protein